jgi:hypothetical protein
LIFLCFLPFLAKKLFQSSKFSDARFFQGRLLLRVRSQLRIFPDRNFTSEQLPTSSRQAPDKLPTSSRQAPDKLPTSSQQLLCFLT